MKNIAKNTLLNQSAISKISFLSFNFFYWLREAGMKVEEGTGE